MSSKQAQSEQKNTTASSAAVKTDPAKADIIEEPKRMPADPREAKVEQDMQEKGTRDLSSFLKEEAKKNFNVLNVRVVDTISECLGYKVNNVFSITVEQSFITGTAPPEPPLTGVAAISARSRMSQRANRMVPKFTTGNASEFTAVREMKEIKILRKYLCESLIGVFIPPLNSRVGKNSGWDQKECERLQVKYFFQALVRHTFARNDTLFKEFFRTDEKFTEAKAKEILSSELTTGPKNIGRDMWNVMLRLIPDTKIPSDPIKICEEHDAELKVLIDQYETMHDNLEKNLMIYVNQQKSEEQLSSAIMRWMAIENAKNLITSKRANPYQSMNITLPLATGVENALEQEAASYTEVIKSLKHLVHVDLPFEISLFKEFEKDMGEVIASVKDYMKRSESSNFWQHSVAAEKERLNIDQARSPSTDDTRNFRHLRQKSAAAGNKMSNAFFRQTSLIKALLVVESKRFQYERTARTAEMLQKTALLMTTKAKNTSTAWLRSYETIPHTYSTTRPSTVELEIMGWGSIIQSLISPIAEGGPQDGKPSDGQGGASAAAPATIQEESEFTLETEETDSPTKPAEKTNTKSNGSAKGPRGDGEHKVADQPESFIGRAVNRILNPGGSTKPEAPGEPSASPDANSTADELKQEKQMVDQILKNDLVAS